ncbi:ABC transporter substrate-binding protein [Nocardia donostiensis]|uniref:glutamate ABC transporter substrate-binding protein n=1 Tax=Nocardia donostiensis TaxID=1538463 RepID=UPI0009D9BB5D|nr:glutamate ABC transporter substrate-binding protein [Nocardia donostiensis]OQS13283.1 ABC transporter substrate-binding protein [Nocardia donostiensis]
MQRLLRRGAVLLAALLLSAGCDSGAPPISTEEYQPPVDTDVSFPPDSTMYRLHESGEIRIGTKFDQPLFGLRNPLTGRPEGFDAEMGKLIAARLGIPAEGIDWVETVSANRDPFLQQGRVDLIIATYTITEARKQVIDFAGPYYVAGQSFLVRAGNPERIGTPEDLHGKTVCAVEGSASSTHFRERVPDADLVLFDSFSKCAQAVKNGQVTAMTTDNTILAGLRSRDEESFDLVDVTFTEEPYGIGVANGRKDLVAFIDDVLRTAFADGSWAAAWDRTAGRILGPAPEPPDLDRY